MKIKNTISAALLNLGLFTYTFAADTCFSSAFGGEVCTYEVWIGQAWGWALGILIPLSVLILAAAGVIYMVSEGDSNRIGLAKKLVVGVFSGVGLLVLGQVILSIIGVGGFWNI